MNGETSEILNKTEPRVDVEFVINKSEKFAKEELHIKTTGECSEAMVRRQVEIVKKVARETLPPTQ